MAFGSEEHKRHYLAEARLRRTDLVPAFFGARRRIGRRRPRHARREEGRQLDRQRQKIWTSGAHYSEYGLLITRTDPNVPKHKGLTMFFLNMKSPGVEVRPIKQANGMQEFTRVYFTDVVIPDHQRLGAVGDGWNVSLTTLMNERMSIGARLATGFPEIFEFCSNLMTDDGPRHRRSRHAIELANWAVKASGLKYTSYRAVSALSKGERPVRENSIGKLVAGSMLQDIAMYAMDLEGAAGVFTGDARKRRAASSSRCCWVRHRCGSPAAPMKFSATSSPSVCWGCPATSGSTRMCRSTRSRPRAMNMDAPVKAPKAHYATEDRIGVLEELLNERYSVRAFLPQEVARETIEHVLTVAQRTASCATASRGRC